MTIRQIKYPPAPVNNTGTKQTEQRPEISFHIGIESQIIASFVKKKLETRKGVAGLV
jgi:hypothetical protein